MGHLRYLRNCCPHNSYSASQRQTVAGIEAFFLAMTIQHDAQRIAQKELDSVIGTDKLPTFSDRARLPYCEALLTEVLRAYTFGPVGR